MEPENIKRNANEPKARDSEAVAGEPHAPQGDDAKLVSPRIKIDGSNIDEHKFSKMSRRELLKVAPVLALGVFAIPRLQDLLLKKGLGFSDWASARLFQQSLLAPTFADAQLTPRPEAIVVSSAPVSLKAITTLAPHQAVAVWL